MSDADLSATTAALTAEFGHVVPPPLIATAVEAAAQPGPTSPAAVAETARADVAAVAEAVLRASASGADPR